MRSFRVGLWTFLALILIAHASFGDLPYDKKLDHYYGQNLLAKSLNPKCYERNPGFISYIEGTKFYTLYIF
jgi:hypothetical protein